MVTISDLSEGAAAANGGGGGGGFGSGTAASARGTLLAGAGSAADLCRVEVSLQRLPGTLTDVVTNDDHDPDQAAEADAAAEEGAGGRGRRTPALRLHLTLTREDARAMLLRLPKVRSTHAFTT